MPNLLENSTMVTPVVVPAAGDAVDAVQLAAALQNILSRANRAYDASQAITTTQIVDGTIVAADMDPALPQALLRGGIRPIPRVGEPGGIPLPAPPTFLVPAPLSALPFTHSLNANDASSVIYTSYTEITGETVSDTQRIVIATPPVGWNIVCEVTAFALGSNPRAASAFNHPTDADRNIFYSTIGVTAVFVCRSTLIKA
jgi:hypothetical protein